VTDDSSRDPRPELARRAETELRCLAHCAAALADALALARTDDRAELGRLSPSSLASTHRTSLGVQQQLHAALAQLDRRLAANVREVADLLHNRAEEAT
jgi:hypothetical protein